MWNYVVMDTTSQYNEITENTSRSILLYQFSFLAKEFVHTEPGQWKWLPVIMKFIAGFHTWKSFKQFPARAKIETDFRTSPMNALIKYYLSNSGLVPVGVSAVAGRAWLLKRGSSMNPPPARDWAGASLQSANLSYLCCSTKMTSR